MRSAESLEGSGNVISLLSLGSLTASLFAEKLRDTEGEIFGIPAKLLPDFAFLLCVLAALLCARFIILHLLSRAISDLDRIEDTVSELEEMAIRAPPSVPPGAMQSPSDRIQEHIDSFSEERASAHQRAMRLDGVASLTLVAPPVILAIASCAVAIFVTD